MGGNELLIIILAAGLLFFGGKKIPGLAKGLGRAMGEFQRGRMEVEQQIKNANFTDSALPDARQEPSTSKKVNKLKLDAGKTDDFQSEESKIVLAARALGIQTEDKSEDDLLREIAKIAGS